MSSRRFQQAADRRPPYRVVRSDGSRSVQGHHYDASAAAEDKYTDTTERDCPATTDGQVPTRKQEHGGTTCAAYR